MIYIDDVTQYKRTKKKSYSVYVCMPKIGTNVQNKLEMSNYVTSEQKRFVIMGTVGETWVIDDNKLAKTYQFTDGSPITPQSLSKRVVSVGGIQLIDWMHLETQPGGGGLNWAMFIPKKHTFQIPTAWGDVLTVNDPRTRHGKGDFIVCADAGGRPNIADRWVVNGEVFPTTYDMRAFPNMGAAIAKEIARPKSIV